MMLRPGWRLDTVDGSFCTVDNNGHVLARRPNSDDLAIRARWLKECLRGGSFDAAAWTLTVREISEIAGWLGCRSRSFRDREEAETTVWATLKADIEGRLRIGKRPDQSLPRLHPKDYERFIEARLQGYGWSEISRAAGGAFDGEPIAKSVFYHLMGRAEPISHLVKVLYAEGVVAKALEHDRCLVQIQDGQGSMSGIYALSFLEGFTPKAAEILAKSGIETLREAADLDELSLNQLVGRKSAHRMMNALCERLDAEHVQQTGMAPR